MSISQSQSGSRIYSPRLRCRSVRSKIQLMKHAFMLTWKLIIITASRELKLRPYYPTSLPAKFLVILLCRPSFVIIASATNPHKPQAFTGLVDLELAFTEDSKPKVYMFLKIQDVSLCCSDHQQYVQSRRRRHALLRMAIALPSSGELC